MTSLLPVFLTHGEFTHPHVCIQSFDVKYHSLTYSPSCLDNYPEPYKRPLSSMAPVIIEHTDGSLYLAAGGSGGSRIFGSVFQTILNLDWGLDASQAVEFGRLHDQLYPLCVDIDNVYPQDLIEDLATRGHNITGIYCHVTSLSFINCVFHHQCQISIA